MVVVVLLLLGEAGARARLAVDRGARPVAIEVLRRTWGGIQAWRALGTAHVWHARRLGGLLWRRGQAWAALGSAARHDAAEEVAGAVANLGRLGLRRAGVVLGTLAGPAAGLELALQLHDALFHPGRAPCQCT